MFPPPTEATQATWTAVDEYYQDLYVKEDAILDAASETAAAAGLPPISVSPTQGKFLNLLCKIVQARRVLEIGTLAGYSTIWLARALPDDEASKVVTLENNQVHARVAQRNIDHAGLSDRVDIKVGPALDILPTIAKEEGHKPFDVIFIDADKVNNKHYYEWALTLARPGSVIVMDNVVRDGKVLETDPTKQDPSTQGIREFNDAVARDPRVSATALQTVGVKGYDGFALLLVN
jgi:predicted O-methyltransferase YrrM